ncbi:MAG: hypothetical protein AB1352_01705 [Patescibacteria group bacterium]
MYYDERPYLRSLQSQGGFSMVETVTAVAIVGLIILAIGVFQGNIFTFNTSLHNQLSGQYESRQALEKIIAEARVATAADNGAYPLEAAQETSFIFYSNVDADAAIERVRYFVSGNTLRRGVIEPSGSPAQYPAGNETVTTILNNLTLGATPVFSYYDTNYSGTEAPLSHPVDPHVVRYVEITFFIDKDPTRPPTALQNHSGVNIRNLKDNL